MKLFKRFFLLKKGLGAAALSLALLAFNSCENMTTVPAPTMTVTASKTLSAPTFPEQTDENGNLIPNLSYGERYYTVSQGLKRKISISWNPVGIAKYYEIWAAQNIDDTFVKVGETTKTEFEDGVASGMTYYYKVRAVNVKGEFSDFSQRVRGTSLATPAITEISITDTSAKVLWYMGNVGIDSYVKNLVYEIHAFKGSEESVVTVKAWDEANQSAVEEYTFENLSGNTEYMFRIDAYVTNDQSAVESSPKVSKNTLALYTPVSPEFTATQGESTKSINLFITLPPKIQAPVDKTTNEDYPICFKIQRREEDSDNWKTVISCLYFTGKTDTPTASDYGDELKNYEEGKVIEWEDKKTSSGSSIISGKKYEYRIISMIDLNYSVILSNGYKASNSSQEKLAKKATGWIANEPSFTTLKPEKTLKPGDADKVINVKVPFTASWDAMGKDSLYKLVIQQSFQKSGTDTISPSWLKVFDSAEEINSYKAEYDLSIGAEFLVGTYQYALYIIPKAYENPDDAVSAKKVVACVQSYQKVFITTDANIPSVEITVEDGWTDKVKVSWFPESGVQYTIKRADITAGSPGTTLPDIGNETIKAKIGGAYPESGNVTYEDEDVEPGKKYTYQLVAITNADTPNPNTYPGSLEIAKTLGTANVAFDDYAYDTIKVKWNPVMAAKTYDITLGEAQKFGGAKKLTINEDGTLGNSDFAADSVASKLEGDKIILTIKTPEGYDDATKSGAKANLTVISNSDKAYTTKDEPVWTIGPASADTKGSGDSGINVVQSQIQVKWKGIKGAAGYAVYRTRQTILGSTKEGATAPDNLESEKTDVYYISADKSKITVNGDAPTSGAVTVTTEGGSYDFDTTYTLTDKYTAIPTSTEPPTKWQVSQSYIGLGINYTYTVLPVLDEADAKDLDSFDATAWADKDNKLAYLKFKTLDNIQKDGYTLGYGLNLEATKAEYTDRVVLMWDKPANIDKSPRYPVLYYRKRSDDNSGSWIKIVDEAKGLPETGTSQFLKNYYTFKLNEAPEALAKNSIIAAERLESFEFVVSYNSSFGGTSGIDKAYIAYLEQIKDERVTAEEAKNVGYLFTIPGINGSKVENPDYSEAVTWQTYDALNSSVERAVAPDSYALNLKNLNINAAYKKLVEYDASAMSAKAKPASYSNISIELPASDVGNGRRVTITPSFNTSGDVGVHNGLLKVQRDYKHYYKITASRTSKQEFYKFGELDTSGDTDFLLPGQTKKEDGTIEEKSEIIAEAEDYACRKISNSEFAKCVTLIVADALHKVSGKEGTLDSKYGSGTFKTEVPYAWTVPAMYHIKYTFSAFKNIFAKLPGSDSPLQSDFILNGTSTQDDGWTYSDIIYQLGSCAITVTHTTGLKSYQGTVTLGAGNYYDDWGRKTKWNLSLKFQNQTTGSIEETVTASDDATKFKLWFPFALWTDLGETQDDGTGGFPTMSETWWQEQ